LLTLPAATPFSKSFPHALPQVTFDSRTDLNQGSISEID